MCVGLAPSSQLLRCARRCIQRAQSGPVANHLSRRLPPGRMLQSLRGALDKVKDKASELRSEAVATGDTLLSGGKAEPLHLCGQDIEGRSIGGQETCVILPRCKVALDIGRCPQRAVYQQTVLFSHGHLDHVGGIAFHASSRALLGLPPPRYVVMKHYADKLRRLLQLTSEMEEQHTAMEYEIIELEAGQEYELPTGHIVRPFPTVHTIPSQGYILYSYRKKLKAELVGRSQDEIRQLRQAGQEVTDTYQIPEVAFTGDTSGALFEQQDGNDDLYKARLLIIELTFVDDTVTLEQARERGHMHISDLVAHAHKFKNEAILLIHFSPRYQRHQILAALDTNMPASLRAKCVPLLDGFA